jgi:hypothetical protein
LTSLMPPPPAAPLPHPHKPSPLRLSKVNVLLSSFWIVHVVFFFLSFYSCIITQRSWSWICLRVFVLLSSLGSFIEVFFLFPGLVCPSRSFFSVYRQPSSKGAIVASFFSSLLWHSNRIIILIIFAFQNFHILSPKPHTMPKFSAILSKMSGRSSSNPEIEEQEGMIIDTGIDPKGDPFFTTSVRTLDETDDERTLDTAFMDVQQIESIRGRDAFMYHSIVQMQRRTQRSLLSEDEGAQASSGVPFDQFDSRASSNSIPREIRDALLDDFGEDEYVVPNDSSQGQGRGTTPTETITRDMVDLLQDFSETLEDDDADSGAGGGGGAAAAAPPSVSIPVPTSRRMPRRLSQSLLPARRRSSVHREDRRFTQSFAGYSTGVVKRQRRVTTECHYSMVVPDPEVMSELMRSSVTLENNSLRNSFLNFLEESDDEPDMDESLRALFDYE